MQPRSYGTSGVGVLASKCAEISLHRVGQRNRLWKLRNRILGLNAQPMVLGLQIATENSLCGFAMEAKSAIAWSEAPYRRSPVVNLIHQTCSSQSRRKIFQ